MKPVPSLEEAEQTTTGKPHIILQIETVSTYAAHEVSKMRQMRSSIAALVPISLINCCACENGAVCERKTKEGRWSRENGVHTH